jgi:hypothetical protein
MGKPENEGNADSANGSQGSHAVNRKSMAADSEAASRSSNAPSREASRGLVAEEQHVGVNGRASSKSALSRLASPNPSTTGRTPLPEDSAQSGTVTRRASTSSQVSSNQPVAPSYGTRSRRQPRGSRPNYAEDVEMDFEVQQPQGNGTHYRAESLSEAELEPDGEAGEAMAQQQHMDDAHEKKKAERNAKRVAARAAARDAKLNGYNSVNGDATPAAESSSLSASNTSTLPRKRKAAAVATQNITASSQPAPPATIVNGKKASATKTSSEIETNMVTFDKCNSRLNKHGNLVADDGTVFSPDGKVSTTCLKHAADMVARVPSRTNSLQITCILFASLQVSRITWVGLWSSRPRCPTIPQRRSS